MAETDAIYGFFRCKLCWGWIGSASEKQNMPAFVWLSDPQLCVVAFISTYP